MVTALFAEVTPKSQPQTTSHQPPAHSQSSKAMQSTSMNRSNSTAKGRLIIVDEENVHPNSSPSRMDPSLKRANSIAKPTKSANSTRRHSSSNICAAPINSSKLSLSKAYNNITLHNVVVFLLVKALIISALINFHMVSVLSNLNLDASLPGIIEDTANLQLETKHDVAACVRNVGGECQLYPCIKDESGAFVETNAPESPFGYAGRFVHRDVDVEKPLMRTIGDRGWGSGCAVSDKYKFVYIHVLKSGGTATKEVRGKSVIAIGTYVV